MCSNLRIYCRRYPSSILNGPTILGLDREQVQKTWVFVVVTIAWGLDACGFALVLKPLPVDRTNFEGGRLHSRTLLGLQTINPSFPDIFSSKPFKDKSRVKLPEVSGLKARASEAHSDTSVPKPGLVVRMLTLNACFRFLEVQCYESY